MSTVPPSKKQSSGPAAAAAADDDSAVTAQPAAAAALPREEAVRRVRGFTEAMITDLRRLLAMPRTTPWEERLATAPHAFVPLALASPLLPTSGLNQAPPLGALSARSTGTSRLSFAADALVARRRHSMVVGGQGKQPPPPTGTAEPSGKATATTAGGFSGHRKNGGAGSSSTAPAVPKLRFSMSGAGGDAGDILKTPCGPSPAATHPSGGSTGNGAALSGWAQRFSRDEKGAVFPGTPASPERQAKQQQQQQQQQQQAAGASHYSSTSGSSSPNGTAAAEVRRVALKNSAPNLVGLGTPRRTTSGATVSRPSPLPLQSGSPVRPGPPGGGLLPIGVPVTETTSDGGAAIGLAAGAYTDATAMPRRSDYPAEDVCGCALVWLSLPNSTALDRDAIHFTVL